MLKGLSEAVASKDKSKTRTIQQGPAPGVKYRGGSPPNPAQWNYSTDDLRAFQTWTRKYRHMEDSDLCLFATQ